MNSGAKPIFVSVAGGIFLYSGIKGMSISTVVRDMLTGRNPAKDTPDVSTTDPAASAGNAGNVGKHQPSSVTGLSAPVPATQVAKTNQDIAKPMAALFGWTEANGEWAALVTLWNNESGWNNRAYNSASGATGIPQAVPGTKMPLPAQAPNYSARAQIAWGLTYIKGRYGSPSKALTFWNRTDPRPYPGHWY